jgi:PAS domain S-box-containing protein
MVIGARVKISLMVLGIVVLIISSMACFSVVIFKNGILALGDQKDLSSVAPEVVSKLKYILSGIGAILFLVALALCLLFTRIFVAPIAYLNACLAMIEKGILPNEIKISSRDEIGQLGEKLNNITLNLKDTAAYASRVGEGKYDENFVALGAEDVLRNSLINMTTSLKEADKREEERIWIVNGVAEIGEILRNTSSLDILSNTVIKYMIAKIHAIQGAFYIAGENQEGKQQIGIAALYAYNRKKYFAKTFLFGEGLAGQAAIEKSTILRTEIPSDYESITSGILGDKKPTCILICPLIANERVYGVVEFAGFNVFSPDEMRFVEEVGPIIARTIFNIQVSEHTQKHLEDSQRMSSELQQQQEELRQNAEEMHSTQEELKNSNQRLEEQIGEVNKAQKRMQSLLENASEVIIIYEKDGRVKYVSPSVTNILGYRDQELIGIREEVNIHEDNRVEFKDIIRKLLVHEDITLTIQYRYKKQNGEWIWLEATGRNMLSDPAVSGIVLNCRDITLKRKAEVEERMRINMQALSENSPDLITRISSEGEIAYTNPAIETYTGIKPSEFLNHSLDNLTIGNGIVASWKSILKDVKDKNEKFSVELKYAAPIGERIMQVNVIPEYNDSNMESVLVVSHDITERKLIEMEVQAKNKNINESINYSKRIQNAILPDNKVIVKSFPQSFIMYKPRDVVSGDFPWFFKKGDNAYIAAVDCTGHGVPGAMLSLVGYFQLNNIVDTHGGDDPGSILDMLDEKVNQTLIRESNDENIKDGMDIAFCKINMKKMMVEYSGAHRPLYYLKDGEIQELKGNKWAIGGGLYKNQTKFTNYKIEVKKGESIFFFSDGLPDQFGGSEGRKFGTARIKSILLEHYGKEMPELNEIFNREFDQWRDGQKQTDDVLLIGIKF